MPCFRLLARDPAALKVRTLTELDIFRTDDGGLGRAERELAATITSRLNGCVYCASVHAGRTVGEGGAPRSSTSCSPRAFDTDLGSDRWNVIRDASRTLASTPMEYNDGCSTTSPRWPSSTGRTS